MRTALRGAPLAAVAENVLRGACTLTASQIQAAFMNSPGHKADILGNFSAVGIGVTCNGTNLYVTVDFGL